MNPKRGDKKPHLGTSLFGLQGIIKPALVEILGDGVVNRLLAKNEFKKFGNSLEEEARENRAVDVNNLQSSLEEMFGHQAGSGLALQVGRASFKYLLKVHGNSLGFFSQSFRLLPLSRKIDKGSKELVEFLEETSSHSYLWEKQQDWYSCQIKYNQSDLCQTSPEPVCMFITGLLLEAFYWMSAGQTYKAEENCHHELQKQTCTIRISCNPID